MKLIALRISNGGLTGEALPTRLKVLGWGANTTVNGVTPAVNDVTLSVLPGNQKSNGFDRVALDYEHNTVTGSAANLATPEPRKVAAFGVPQVVQGDGLYLDDLVWTPSGAEFAREYCDLSPCVQLNGTNQDVSFLHSVALCRQGAVDDLHFFTVEINSNKGNAMDMEALAKEVAALKAALEEITKKMSGPEPVVELSAKVTDLTAKLETLSATAQTDAARLAELTTKLTTLTTTTDAVSIKRDKDALMTQAATAGKVVTLSADAIEKLSVADLQDHITKLSATVPLTSLTEGAGNKPVDRTALIETFTALPPAERSAFYRENREKLVG